MMRIFFLTLLLTISFDINAREVDNDIARDVDLKDVGFAIDVDIDEKLIAAVNDTKVSDHKLPPQDVAETDESLEPVSPPESGNPLPKKDDEWRYTIAFPMLWAPSINGKIRGDEPIDFEVTFKDILDDLSFGLMFELYANRGPFGLAFKSNYMRLQDENSKSGLLNTRVQTTLEMGVNDLLVSFRVHDKVRLVTGVRHVLAKMELDIYSTLGSTEILNEQIIVVNDNKFDLLVGINFNHWFNKKWAVMLNADVGVVGDNDRDYGTDLRVLYRLSSLNNLWFGYRYLNIGNDTTTNGITYSVDMTQTGPTIGWAFTF